MDLDPHPVIEPQLAQDITSSHAPKGPELFDDDEPNSEKPNPETLGEKVTWCIFHVHFYKRIPAWALGRNHSVIVFNFVRIKVEWGKD